MFHSTVVHDMPHRGLPWLNMLLQLAHMLYMVEKSVYIGSVGEILLSLLLELRSQDITHLL
jgi:hypothetical protein